MRLDDSYYIINAGADGFENIKTILFTHGKYGKYEFREESDGTKRILELLEMVTSPEKDVTYIVDEKDEIYFATNRNGESTFVRLDEFETSESRSDLNIETSYLNGRYGGIPILIRCEDANE